MNFSCSICCNCFETTDEIYTTRCGHVFHFTCLSEWLNRSDTCPQCRERTSSAKIRRLYFNISNNDTILEDSATLHEEIENLKLLVVLRNTEVEHFKEKSERHEKEIVELKKTLSDWENQVQNKNSFIHTLEEHVKYYVKKHIDGLKYQEQAEVLQNKLNNLQDLQKLLESSNEEADEIISTTNDPRELATYVSALKRELTIEAKNCRDYKTKMIGLKLKNNELKNKLKKIPSREEAIRLESKNRKMRKSTANVSGTSNFNIFHDVKLNDENKENYFSFNVQLNRGNASGQSTLTKKPLSTPPTSPGRCSDECDGSEIFHGLIRMMNFPQTTSAGAREKSAHIVSMETIDLSNDQSSDDDFLLD